MAHPFFQYPKHLFHESKPPIIAHTSSEESKAREEGYGDTYIPQEYPKMMPDGKVIHAPASAPESEKEPE